MRLFLDTAEIDEVRLAAGWGVIDGVTTNPTLIARAGADHETRVKEICALVGNVSAEVVSERQDDIVAEGRRIASWHPEVIVKVPLTPDGLAAGKILAGEGLRINVTLCFSVGQALLAAAVGAHIVSPFIGRIVDVGGDGVALIRDIVAAYRQQGIKTLVLAASIRDPRQVAEVAIAGAHIATMPFKVLEMMFKHPLTDIGLERFLADYRRAKADSEGRRPAEARAKDAAAAGAR